jgi:hypothetical protein
MQSSQKYLVAVSTVAIAIVTSTLFANSAAADPIRFDGTYVGAGVAAGVTNGGQANDAATFGGNIQGRIGIPNAPVSVRGAVLFGGDNAAIMPMVTYDQRISNNANIYAGVGYSFVDKDNQPSPLGNRNSVVLTLGAEAEMIKQVVVYGDAKWGINAYENSSADALSFQAGLGYRF